MLKLDPVSFILVLFVPFVVRISVLGLLGKIFCNIPKYELFSAFPLRPLRLRGEILGFNCVFFDEMVIAKFPAAWLFLRPAERLAKCARGGIGRRARFRF